MTVRTWVDRTYPSRDGLRLHYREYPGPGAPRLALLCLAGLTRNARDFEVIAPRIARTRRVLCADLRGRGRSQHDPHWEHYSAAVYVADLLDLLDHAGVRRLLLLGTSLGGILSMLLAAARPSAVAGVILNDVGPEVASEGLRRIATDVGRLAPVGSWEEAVAQARATYGHALPGLSEAQWQAFARRTYSEVAGVPRLDMDPRIGDAVRATPVGAAPNLWPAFAALESIPTLAIRGALSDLLSAETFDRMASVKPDLERVTVPDRGHPPLLDEPVCDAAIDAFLGRLP
ncbi:MAG TPA: alpha/beta hydrolase [Steroidobacteraceae bacterium]|nr:alpha/beta hydrolase [Steroidobacteraceae bacterium]